MVLRLAGLAGLAGLYGLARLAGLVVREGAEKLTAFAGNGRIARRAALLGTEELAGLAGRGGLVGRFALLSRIAHVLVLATNSKGVGAALLARAVHAQISIIVMDVNIVHALLGVVIVVPLSIFARRWRGRWLKENVAARNVSHWE